MMKRAVGVILGGGRGTRLYPLTKYRSKPAIPIGGKYRLVDVAISNCINSGINKIYVLTQYNSESLNRHINSTYKFDVFNSGFTNILAAEQTLEREQWYQGTADAVRQNLQHLLHADCDYIFVLSGDSLCRINYEAMLKHHIEKDADITIAASITTEKNTKALGILKINSSTMITNFIEKPNSDQLAGYEAPKSIQKIYNVVSNKNHYLCSMGLYVFKKQILVDLLKNSGSNDFGKNVIPSAISTHNVYAYPFTGYYLDIGTINALYQMHMDMLKKDPPFEFFIPGSPVYTHPRFLPNCIISNCRIIDSKISEGSIIYGEKIVKSVLGVRSFVNEGSILENVVMMGADYYKKDLKDLEKKRKSNPDTGIGKNCHIQKAIIDKNAVIGNNVKIMNHRKIDYFDGKNYFIRDGIVIIPKNAVIPSNTEI